MYVNITQKGKQNSHRKWREELSQSQDPESLGICFVLALANLGFSEAGVRLGHRVFSISPGT